MLTKLSSIIFLFLLCSFSYGQDKIIAEKGVIDLKDWNVSDNPYFEINGNWEFYYNKHILPWEYSSEDSLSKSFGSCTNTWNSYGEEYPAFGFATYRLYLKNLPNAELNILVRSVTCAVSVYADHELVAQIGQVGTTPELEIQRYEEKVVSLPHNKKNVTLTILLSNWKHKNGGLNNPWYIGTEEALYNIHRKHIMVNGIEASSFLFAGLFFLTLYIFRRKDKALLFFSLYALTFFPRPLISVNYMITSVWPDINWNVMVHMEYFTLFIPAGFMVLFIRERFKDQAPTKLLMVLAGTVFTEALITLFFPIRIFTWLPIPHQIVSLAIVVAVSYTVIKAMRQRESGALFAGIAILCLIMSSTYIAVLYLDLIPPMPYAYTALQMAFLLSMSMILGSKFASQFRKVEYLQIETAQQKEEIEEQHQILELKNEEITSSITYARRIQSAILPPTKTLSSVFPNSFILYKPKDIVAGDFYWVEKVDDLIYIAAADCTGHGVPGAMVSVVCNSALNRSIREFNLKSPGDILDKTRELVIETFDQSEEEVKDGMDVALCCINTKTNELTFSGANNPVWIIRQNENLGIEIEGSKIIEENGSTLIEFKGDKQPIGMHYASKPFSTIQFNLEKGDRVYLFSDGYADQFGGDKGKKFMYKPMKKLVMAMYNESFISQRNIMDDQFENWRGGIEQTDDVCVIGFQV